jgi:predicted RNA-binding protein with PIN domain
MTVYILIVQVLLNISTCCPNVAYGFQEQSGFRTILPYSLDENGIPMKLPSKITPAFVVFHGGHPSYVGNPYRIFHRTSMILFMGKGDGKKKRPKKSATTTSSFDGSSATNKVSTTSSFPSSSSVAPRVSNQINIPVRHQIKLAQLNKEYQNNGNSFRQKKVERTSYRRAWDEEEIIEKAEERKRRGQDPDWDVILNRTAVQPLVIVDGYNIIHKWARLKKHMTKGDTSRARQLLIDDLENLRAIKGWRIEVVFDGAKRSLTGPIGHGPGGSSTTIPQLMAIEKSTRKDVSKFGVRVIYTGAGIEADTYIEERCMSAKNITGGSYTGSLIIATDDGMIRLAGQNAGAMCMGTDRFVQELKALQHAISYRVEAAMSKVNGQPIRPEKLRGTHIFTGSRFGKRSILIEDKRNRTKTTKQQLSEEEIERIIGTIKVEETENGIPWWAKVPNQTLRPR